MKNKKHDFRTAYIDLLINLLTGTFVLFILTTLLIAVTKTNEGIKKNADYVISLEWSKEIDCDVDLWLRDPLNNVVSYRTKEAGLMYYERDDMGKRMSVFEVNGKKTSIDPDNKEYITLRGTFPGEYVLNVHLYSCLNTEQSRGLPPGTLMEVPLIVELTQINPAFSVIKRIEMKLDSVWQEKTVLRFVMNDQKHIIRFKNEYVSIITEKKGMP